MHIGGRSSKDIDDGGALAEFTGVLVRDGYAGYGYLPAVHAWCAAHLIGDLWSVCDSAPAGQQWAAAMTDTLTGVHDVATAAWTAVETLLDSTSLATLMTNYLGATTDLANGTRTLIRRYQDMILRSGTDLTAPCTNNQAERDIRNSESSTTELRWDLADPGRTDRIRVHPLLSVHRQKWGKKPAQALNELFTTNAWPPSALPPSWIATPHDI